LFLFGDARFKLGLREFVCLICAFNNRRLSLAEKIKTE
jgi:hypothetical protein